MREAELPPLSAPHSSAPPHGSLDKSLLLSYSFSFFFFFTSPPNGTRGVPSSHRLFLIGCAWAWATPHSFLSLHSVLVTKPGVFCGGHPVFVCIRPWWPHPQLARLSPYVVHPCGAALGYTPGLGQDTLGILRHSHSSLLPHAGGWVVKVGWRFPGNGHNNQGCEPLSLASGSCLTGLVLTWGHDCTAGDRQSTESGAPGAHSWLCPSPAR